MTYSEIEKLPVDAYLNPDLFGTSYDQMHSEERKTAKELEGYELGLKCRVFVINWRGVWSAEIRDRSYITSCEGIGYHAITKWFLMGVLRSNCPIVVYRRMHTAVCIKGGFEVFKNDMF